jgi:hypothetical protein
MLMALYGSLRGRITSLYVDDVRTSPKTLLLDLHDLFQRLLYFINIDGVHTSQET